MTCNQLEYHRLNPLVANPSISSCKSWWFPSDRDFEHAISCIPLQQEVWILSIYPLTRTVVHHKWCLDCSSHVFSQPRFSSTSLKVFCNHKWSGKPSNLTQTQSGWALSKMHSAAADHQSIFSFMFFYCDWLFWFFGPLLLREVQRGT